MDGLQGSFQFSFPADRTSTIALQKPDGHLSYEHIVNGSGDALRHEIVV